MFKFDKLPSVSGTTAHYAACLIGNLLAPPSKTTPLIPVLTLDLSYLLLLLCTGKFCCMKSLHLSLNTLLASYLF